MDIGFINIDFNNGSLIIGIGIVVNFNFRVNVDGNVRIDGNVFGIGRGLVGFDKYIIKLYIGDGVMLIFVVIIYVVFY